MKKTLILFVISALILFTSCTSKDKAQTAEKIDVVQAFKESYENSTEALDLKTALVKMGIDLSKPIAASDLAIINYILKNTYEISIHQMRGEDGNEVYSNDDGREVVYDKEGNLVTNAWNKGSFNYAPYSQPVDKFLLDIFPWMVWGNARDDPTSIEERIYYYTRDLWFSVQAYIFLEDQSELEDLSYSKLSEEEKEVYHLFYKIFLNDDYEIKLNGGRESIIRLQTDEAYFLSYVDQLMNTFGFYRYEDE